MPNPYTTSLTITLADLNAAHVHTSQVNGLESNSVHILAVENCEHVHEGDELRYYWVETFALNEDGDSPPANWSEVWNPASTWTVRCNSNTGTNGLQDSVDNRCVHFAEPAQVFCGLKWDDIPADSEVEILARFTGGDSTVSDNGPGLFVRGSGGSASENAYILEMYNYYQRIYTGKVVAGAVTWSTNKDLNDHWPFDLGIAGNTYIWVRFQVSGVGTIKIKCWGRGLQEPDDWFIETSATGVTAGGNVGFYTRDQGGKVDYFAIGIAGYSPPVPRMEDIQDSFNSVKVTQYAVQVIRQRPTLTVASCAHAHSAPNLTVAHVIPATDLVMTDGGAQHVHPADNVIIDPAWVYPADCTHVHTAPELPATQVYPDDCTHVHSAPNLTLTEIFTLVISDAGLSQHVHTAPNLALAVPLTVNACSHVSTSPEIDLAQHFLVVADASSLSDSIPENIELIQTGSVTLTLINKGEHVVDSWALGIWWMQDAQHAHSASNVAPLIQVYVLTVLGCSHPYLSTVIGLGQHFLIVADSSHLSDSIPENIGLTQVYVATVADSSHVTTSTEIGLAQHFLIVADSSHVHPAETFNLIYGWVYPNDSAHVLTDDGPFAIAQKESMVVQSATHEQLAQPVGIESNNVFSIAPHPPSHVHRTGGDWRNDHFTGTNGTDPGVFPQWYKSGNAAASLDIQNNKANCDDTGSGQRTARMNSRWEFQEFENFDIVIDFDYTVLGNPAGGWSHPLRFGVINSEDGGKWCLVGRSRDSSNGYLGQDDLGWGAYSQADTSGRLRIRRVNGDTIRVQVWNAAGYWEWNSGGDGSYNQRNRKISARCYIFFDFSYYYPNLWACNCNADNFRILSSDQGGQNEEFPNLRLFYSETLVVQDATHVHSAPNIQLPIVANAKDCSHAITESVPIWFIQHATHAQEADNVIIDPAWVYPNDCTHVHLGDNVKLILKVNDSSHVVTNTTCDLIVLLAVTDAAHVLYTQDPLWWVRDCSHTLVDTGPLGFILPVADCIHVHTVDRIALAKMLRVGGAVHFIKTPTFGLITDPVSVNWGHDSCAAETKSGGPARRAQYGMSPNLSGKILYVTEVALYEWESAVTEQHTARFAIYQGDMNQAEPSPAAPIGEDLILDAGEITPLEADGYVTKAVAKTFIRKNAPTWLAYKSWGDNQANCWNSAYDTGSPGPGDFDAALYFTGGVDQTLENYSEHIPWEDPYPNLFAYFGINTFMGIYMELSVESALQLTVNGCIHAHYADDFIAEQMVAPASCVHLHTADNIIIDPAWVYPQDCIHLHVATDPLWWVDDCSHVHTAPNLRFVIGVQSSSHVLVSASGFPSNEIQLILTPTVDFCTHVHPIGSFAITQDHLLAPENCSHVHTATNITLDEWEMLRVDDSSHVFTGQVDVTQLHILGLDSCLHIHAPPNVAITQDHLLANLNSSHACVVPNVSLTQDHNLTVAPAASLHSAEVIELGLHLIISPCAHVTSSDTLALTQEHSLAIAGDTLAHILPNLAMIVPITLEDCVHSVTSDSDILLTAFHFLAVVGTNHVHVVTGLLLLFQLHFLEVAGTGMDTNYNVHVHLATSIDFGYLSADLGGADLTIVEWRNL
jgi:hypothetical protein